MLSLYSGFQHHQTHFMYIMSIFLSVPLTKALLWFLVHRHSMMATHWSTGMGEMLGAKFYCVVLCKDLTNAVLLLKLKRSVA